MAWAQGVGVALQFTSSVVLARWLTPYEGGIFGLALATVGVLSLIQSLGLHAMLVREENITPEIIATAFSVNAAISTLLALLILGASFFAGEFLNEDGVRKVMLVVAATPLFGIFGFLPSAMMEREGNFRCLAIIGTLSSLTSTVATIAFAIAGFSYMSVAWAQWVGSLTGVILGCWLGAQHVSFRFGFSAWKRVAHFGFQMVAVTGMAQIVARISEMCLGKVLGLSALGLFNRGVSINQIVWNNVHAIIGRVLFVDFARSYRSGESLRGRYIQAVTIITALLWPAFAGLAVVGKPFIYYVYGAKWVGSYSVLVLITLASIGLVASTLTWEIFAATGNLRTQTRIEYIRSIISLTTFVGACFISLEAAAATRVLDSVVAFVLYRPHLNRMTQTSLRDFVPVYGKSILLTLAAIAPAFTLMAVHGFAPDVSLLQLAAAIVLGVILWLAVLVLTRHPLIKEIGNVLRSRQIVRI
jgi:O-antigen/teichoic acid export membrane protein